MLFAGFRMKSFLLVVVAFFTLTSCGTHLTWREGFRDPVVAEEPEPGNTQSYYFFSSTSFTVPSGFTSATLEVIGAGGGGGGGGNGSSSATGGAGGRGGYASKTLDVTLLSGQLWTIQVGTGGTAAQDMGCNALAGTAGSASGVSYWDGATQVWGVMASGGLGGGGTTGCNPGVAGSNGSGAGGDVNGVSGDATYGLPGYGGIALGTAGATTGTAGSAGYVVLHFTE